jgi:DAACS family dicarboxylate/amino acid:cation (Na+ or H+) symporter
MRLLFIARHPALDFGAGARVTGLGDVRQLGRIGLKTLAYTVSVSAIAVLLGIGLVNLLQPGTGIPEAKRQILLRSSPVAAGT